MAELLLELLSEEIPARMQDRAAADLKRLVCDRLAEAGLSYDSAEAYATPRRLALVVDGLPEKQPDISIERKGPRADAPERAIAGFLKSVGLARDRVEERDTPKGKVLFAVIEKTGSPTADVLAGILPDAIGALPWPKSMRWGAREGRWVRPLHGVLGLFDGAVVAFSFLGVEAADVTTGHRFMAAGEFTVSGFADYRDKLRAAYVMLDSAERRSVIEQDAALAAEAEGLALKPDAGLVAEVAGLVEWPVVLTGAIDADYMDLPAEVLTTAMRHHLKHFSLLDTEGNLAPRFVVVANIHAGDGGKQIVAGNERVLRARLADAKFFWDQDRKRTLESRIEDFELEDVVFHAQLGSLGQKVDRIDQLAIEITKSVPGAKEGPVREAAQLCKVDLMSQMVGEFPELQGVIGRYYALGDGKGVDVADAIAEHYSPLGPNDVCPSAPVSVAIAIADKIDTLVGLFAIGEKPTGSKDPFALRRAALGVIRLIVENELRLPLTKLIGLSYQLHAQTQSSKLESQIMAADDGYLDRESVGPYAYLKSGNEVSDELLGFFADRLKVHLKEKGVRHDLIAAVFALGDEDDLVRLLARVEALGTFLASEDGEHLLTAYRRAANIVRIEEKKDGASYDGVEVDDKILLEKDERELAKCLIDVWERSWAAFSKDDFVGAMSALARLRKPVDDFFDNVMVNFEGPATKEKEELRHNRLCLLSTIRNTMNRVGDFSKIEG